ncbi:MAG: hypothetical protein WD696_20230 [Bryobacteraceae bacterium]
MKTVLIAVALATVAFLVGFVPKYFENQELQAALERTRTQLEISSLHSQLGMILIEIERNNFGNARERSTVFFNQLQSAAQQAQDEAIRRRLEEALQRRDEITSDLASLRPETADKIREMYISLYDVATAGPGSP